jgi:hypothetical protein
VRRTTALLPGPRRTHRRPADACSMAFNRPRQLSGRNRRRDYRVLARALALFARSVPDVLSHKTKRYAMPSRFLKHIGRDSRHANQHRRVVPIVIRNVVNVRVGG